MAENGVELELKDYASSGNKNPISPTRQPTNYDSLKEHDSNNGSTEETFTLSEAVEAIGMGKYQILLILMAGFINMCDSLELLLLSILAPTIHCLWHLSSWEEALITTIVFVGMAAGCPLWGWLSDNFGRKSTRRAAACMFFKSEWAQLKTRNTVNLDSNYAEFISVNSFDLNKSHSDKMIVISASWLGYFGFLSSFSPHYLWIVALRCLVGVGIGGIPTMYTLLIEFLPIHVRSYIILCLAWLPESPRYLVAVGEREKGLAELSRMARINKAKFPQGILKTETENVERGSFLVLFNAEYAVTTLLIWLSFFTCGFLYYESLSVSTPDCGCKLLTTEDYISLLWTTFAEFPGIFVTMLFLERLGRKRTLAGEFLLIAGIFCLMFICTDRNILLLLIFMARGLSLGVFQGFFVYTPEVYPTVVRSIGLGCGSAMARIGAMVTPYIAQVRAYSTVSFFCFCCF
ncbi:Synaptic vesicle 2-related protein [Acropora cervicornis]|uniref:Synaptic vesicle 2-related protein n=1 Tax=Acropora cervicornis TaxID=6130 RepID=A0AAD9R790_ACRCE|nr:Synaptic vesicle 2-related protein [Acropora cervicornis]